MNGDKDEIVKHLNYMSEVCADRLLKVAADMLEDLFDRHWNECVQIAEYDDEVRKCGLTE